MIDTHCHLTDERLLSQLPDVLQRADAAGIRRMITIGTDIEDDRDTIELCRGRTNLRCAIGIHPNYVQAGSLEQVPLLRALAAEASVVALGEMGLDYHYQYAERQAQRDVFAAQLALASELAKPVVIHCREAIDDCLAVLRDHPSLRCVFHCFTGTADEARRILDSGYLLGFTGVITFKKSEDIKAVVALTPMDRLLVETDAPYLTPEPMRRQKVNEPALIIHTAAEVARIKGLEPAQVEQQVESNAAAFFNWP